MIKITLNNVDNSFEGYQKLIKVYNDNKDCLFEQFEIDFQGWFSANLCSALGGILDKLILNFNEISINNNIDIIKSNNFTSYFGGNKIPDIHNTTIQYLKFKPSDSRFFHKYIIEELLNRDEFVQTTLVLKKKVAESIYEIFNNAQIHSETNFIYTCGQFYPKKKEIDFTITDTGIGFKNKINSVFKKNLNSIQAIKWATTEGSSTKQNVSGGIGLAILKEFIKKNKGSLEIISDDGFYKIDSNGEHLKNFSGAFSGTIINMKFRIDDISHYFIIDENIENIF